MSHDIRNPCDRPPAPEEVPRARGTAGGSGPDRAGGELAAGSGVEELAGSPGRAGPDPAGSSLGSPWGAAGPDFDVLIDQYGRRLYVLAYRLCGDPAEAEDLSQEALVRGFRASPGFRGEADFYTYLYRTLLNLWSNRLRRRRRWRMVPLLGGSGREREGASLAERMPDRSPGPHERAVGQQQAERLHRALAAMDPGQRAVLVLRVAEELDYEEIASALGIPVGTVRSRLARARARIRRLMED
ncbi:MAG: RNA polymerase sigma factor [Acidobacteriota bacterium]